MPSERVHTTPLELTPDPGSITRPLEALAQLGFRLGHAGAHLFAEEVRAGREEKESELRERLGLVPDAGPRSLAPAPPTEPPHLEDTN